jgi:hypothetical protein
MENNKLKRHYNAELTEEDTTDLIEQMRNEYLEAVVYVHNIKTGFAIAADG